MASRERAYLLVSSKDIFKRNQKTHTCERPIEGGHHAEADAGVAGETAPFAQHGEAEHVQPCEER
eukprot:1072866-Amphidinium_carterae.1